MGVKSVFLGVDDKIKVFKDYLKENNIELEETSFMGEDLPYIKILELGGWSCCPHDAAPEVRKIVDYISDKKGGNGCVRDIIEQVLTVHGDWSMK